MPGSNSLSRVYRLLRWPDDPYTPEGRARYEEVVGEAGRVLSHPWLKELVGGRESVKLLDLCGGAGIAAAAFARALLEAGIQVEVTIVDLRADALAKAERFLREEVPEAAVRVVEADVRRVHRLGIRADLATLWGLTTPHFSPWDLIRVLSSTSATLPSDGAIVIEETDRHATIFLRNKYERILLERASSSEITISAHRDRNPITGYVSRTLITIPTGETAELKIYFWDIASTATLTWALFRNVDFIKGKTPHHGYIVGKWPRKELRPEEIAEAEPEALKHAARVKS